MWTLWRRMGLLRGGWTDGTNSRNHGDTKRSWEGAAIQTGRSETEPCGSGAEQATLPWEALMRTSHDKAHAVRGDKGVKTKNPDNYYCCVLCLGRDASGLTL